MEAASARHGKPEATAGGALAVFVLVYLFNPAKLVSAEHGITGGRDMTVQGDVNIGSSPEAKKPRKHS